MISAGATAASEFTPRVRNNMAADAGSGDRAKWQSFRDGKKLECDLAVRLVSGLSGPARLTCMTMEADQLHPLPGDGPVGTADERRNIAGLDNVMNVLEISSGELHPLPGDGPVGTADERRNIAGLDNVMNVLEMSPLVKKLPARRMSSSTTSSETKGEPIAMWLVRYRWSRQCHVTALQDVAGWQAQNLAGLTEDRMNVWCHLAP